VISGTVLPFILFLPFQNEDLPFAVQQSQLGHDELESFELESFDEN
jgi:hypothetical protein